MGAAEAGVLLGTDVEDADPASSKAGICSFTSRSASEDGNVSYAIVTGSNLALRRAYFRLFARRCAGVNADAPNAAACARYASLSRAQTLSDYYAARTAGGTPVAGLGEAAASDGAALYVRRGEMVVEAAVRREDRFDLSGSRVLAQKILERLRPPSRRSTLPVRRSQQNRSGGSA